VSPLILACGSKPSQKENSGTRKTFSWLKDLFVGMIADLKANPKQQPRLIHREQSMAEQVSVTGGVVEQVARIVGSYVRHHQIEPGQLMRLIGEVHRALRSLGQSAASVPEPRHPAVPIRQSVRREYVVCLECGFRSRMLRRHLRVQHGLSVDEYRDRWNLRSDHPVTAPAYSQHRSEMAKEFGLGRQRVQVEPPPTPPRRRRRRPPTTT
jgi:predicted transcriptional regulator